MSTAPAHSTLGPSSAKRWMNCPGCIALSAKAPPQKPRIYAVEGTVAHSLAEQYVIGKIDFLDLQGRLGSIVSQEGFDIEVTEDMIDGAVEYHDLIMGDRALLEADKKKHPASIVGAAELRVHAPSVDARLWGTADYVLYRVGHKLIVYDYKYGKGEVVEVEENEQGALYVLGVLETLKLDAGGFEEIEFVICQPRASHADGTIRRWTVERTWLEQFRKTAQRAAVETLNPKAKLEAGSWCRWCPAQPFCPAMHKAAALSAQAAFDMVPPAGPMAKMEGRLPDVRLMTEAQLVAAYRWEDAVNSFFEAVKEVLRERLTSGQAVPGVKLVEGRSNRAWVSEAEVEAKFGAVLGDKLFERKILSPAKLEKVVGKQAGVDAMTFKPEGKKSIALDSDPRPAARSSAQDAFDALPAPAPVAAAAAAACVECDVLGPGGCSTHGAKMKEPMWPQ